MGDETKLILPDWQTWRSGDAIPIAQLVVTG